MAYEYLIKFAETKVKVIMKLKGNIKVFILKEIRHYIQLFILYYLMILIALLSVFG